MKAAGPLKEIEHNIVFETEWLDLLILEDLGLDSYTYCIACNYLEPRCIYSFWQDQIERGWWTLLVGQKSE